jgi:hypothetical protein
MMFAPQDTFDAVFTASGEIAFRNATRYFEMSFARHFAGQFRRTPTNDTATQHDNTVSGFTGEAADPQEERIPARG